MTINEKVGERKVYPKMLRCDTLKGRLVDPLYELGYVLEDKFRRVYHGFDEREMMADRVERIQDAIVKGKLFKAGVLAEVLDYKDLAMTFYIQAEHPDYAASIAERQGNQGLAKLYKKAGFDYEMIIRDRNR